MRTNHIAAATSLALALAALQVPSPSHASPSRATLLARLMVGEAGWRAEVEHAALAWTITRRARVMRRRRGWTWNETFERYTRSGYTARPHSSRHRWVAALDEHGERPGAFPSHLSWPRHARRWQAVLDRARAFLRGQLADPCSGPTEHWAAEWVGPRGAMAEADCGPTRNRFYVVR